jgi:hypothetical protein
LKRTVDIFHLFDAHAGLLPLYLRAERAKSRLLREARTFLTVNSLRDFGAFSPQMLQSLDISARYFGQDGIEFYGKASALKAALQFCDRVAIVEGNVAQKRTPHRNGATMDGVVAANAHKVTQWLSERSVKAHVDMYQALLGVAPEISFQELENKKYAPAEEDPIQKAIQMWGPFPPDRYGVRTLSLLVQSPKKAYVFWEWNDTQPRHLGLLMENESLRQSIVLVDGAGQVGEYWFDVNSANVYSAILAERMPDGSWKPLLRSAHVRVPRSGPSANRAVVFIDVRTKARTSAMTPGDVRGSSTRHGGGEGSSAWEWTVGAVTHASSLSLDNPTSAGL